LERARAILSVGKGEGHEFQTDDLELCCGVGGGGFLFCGIDFEKSRHAEAIDAGIRSSSVVCDFSGDGDCHHALQKEQTRKVSLRKTFMTNADNQTNWHWAEGIKFALEGVKLLFLLNGAASVSVLTFIGNVRPCSGLLIGALLAFAIGAASTIPAMTMAYLTQLHYGNASINDSADIDTWRTAGKFHYWAYAFMALGLACFLTGITLAAFGLWNIPSTASCPTHA
jgi:hypothetical protein